MKQYIYWPPFWQTSGTNRKKIILGKTTIPVDPGGRAARILLKKGMLILLSLLGLSVASAAILVRELRSAPEAYEDQTGFHVVDETSRISRFRAPKPPVTAAYEEDAVVNA